MYEHRFSAWSRWIERGDLQHSGSPGVYVIARCRSSLRGKKFSWRRDIIYVGMTNGISGLAGRLNQFDSTLAGRLAHGGADRVRFKYRNYRRLVPYLFVSVVPFKCDPRSNLPADLKRMGDVARFEFLCLAEFATRYARLPPFNDKANALKFSRQRLKP